MNIQMNPRRIEWSGPEGWIVWADEDGCHVRTQDGQCLEHREVERLFALWSNAKAAVTSGQVEAPRVPTREEITQGSYDYQDRMVMKRATRAIKSEFQPDTNVVPF